MDDFNIIKFFLEERKNLTYTLNQLSLIVRMSPDNKNKNYSVEDVKFCLKKNNIKVKDLLCYDDLLKKSILNEKENIIYNSKFTINKLLSWEKIIILSFSLNAISPVLMTTIMSIILLYQINKERLINIKSFFEIASIFGLIYTIIFNFFVYDIFNDFDNHISIYPFNPTIFTITTLLYYFFCKFSIITFLFPLFLYLSYKTSMLISLCAMTMFYIILIFFSQFKVTQYAKINLKKSIDIYLEDYISLGLLIIIISGFNYINQTDDLYYNLYKTKNIDYCTNINKNFEIIKRSNKSNFIVIDSKNFKFEEVLAYIILNNGLKTEQDFNFDNNKFSYNHLIELIKNENMSKGYKNELTKSKIYEIQKMFKNDKIFKSLYDEAKLIDLKTLKIIEYYINSENKERFFYYKCE